MRVLEHLNAREGSQPFGAAAVERLHPELDEFARCHDGAQPCSAAQALTSAPMESAAMPNCRPKVRGRSFSSTGAT
jgi:hypothetical protein